ncbi:TlpA family protein disulfide reductase [Rubrobacter radiotolerans]|uniref:TlpA disulfide reductase family protein n=1 Tax=Rubrobacter radiotolerans TaxID=42256 RepID=A0AB35T2N0_RUBRA|nr:TlpA disulfide reductase family protein [Rubrobacter radiotolerans]MDX5892728.1 TlpA disulfide reductase family protein [Rubrobacter radiotolerans]SMC02365.1 Thiol-disulfide isomerase or thioredoxin [Rubrobacter radiotolerans DSM 5868]
MARNTTSDKNKAPGKKGRIVSNKEVKQATSGSRPLVLALAGFTAVAIVVLVVIAVLSAGGGESASDFTPNDQGLIQPGETAPAFTAENLNGGGTFDLEGGQNATMLVFFATWCPHCQNEAPVISELEEQYEARGLEVVMVGIDGQDTPEGVRQFSENFDIQSPTVYDPQLGGEYSVSGYPTTYVLDGERRVVGAHSGEAPREVFEGWIEEALG